MKGAQELKFRDPRKGRQLATRLAELIDEICREQPERGEHPVSIMHVCGSHEQAIAKFGLRSVLPKGVDLLMGPGCPVCVTDVPEVDEAVALAAQGVHVATYGDMLRVPGTAKSLADAQADGGRIHVVYSVAQAIEIARRQEEELVFFASGFETTAVTTAAAIAAGDYPSNFSVLSAHKYIPPAMEIVAEMPESRIEGYLAAGHAATITGWGIFEEVARRHQVPIVVAGFEPLDILAALVKVVELIRGGEARVENMYPRCVTREGNRAALEHLWKVFRLATGKWRGIAEIPDGNLRLRDEYAAIDARKRFDIRLEGLWDYAPREHLEDCICGDIMAGKSTPLDCRIFGKECLPDTPVGACMVSNEGTCKIWHQYGGRPDLREVA